MRRRSSDTAGARYVDRRAVTESLREAARRGLARDRRIRRVILFGSFADGTATAASDADVLVVLESSPHRRRMDRIPELTEIFTGLDIAIDIIPVTEDELSRETARPGSFLSTVLESGVELASASPTESRAAT